MYWSNVGTTRWDPIFDLRRLQREMNRLFEGTGSGVQSGEYPALNIWSNGEEVIVTTEVPGVDPKAIEISVLQDQLTIQGERPGEELAEDVVCHRAEREAGRFVRSVRLPFEVDNEKVTASCEQGVLTIHLPRSERTKPRRIEISGA